MTDTPLPRADLVSRLRAAGCVFAEDEAEVLIDAAHTASELEEMVARRVAGLPLEQVVGWAEFCGLRIQVDPGVFVPRRRTEFLVDRAAHLAREQGGDRTVVLDLCCGTGALGVALAAALQDVELHAADVDPTEVACARRNISELGEVYEGDLFTPLPTTLRGRVDILAANVPYVPHDEIELLPAEARLHEARVALDGGTDGLEILRRVAADAPDWLAPGGHLLVETTERQAPTAVDAFAASGLLARVETDDELGATVVIGTASARR